jgi:single-stranded-DNA-specific exonuclease
MIPAWHMSQPCSGAVAALAGELHCSPILATLLVNRGIADALEARRHLDCPMETLPPPAGIPDLQPAVERIHRALQRSERILIFGDYDVDGVTATALLLQFLRHCGAQVSYHIPHRCAEGYGLQPSHLAPGAVGRTADLILTVDCGVSSHEAIAAARAAGIDVIVTDHHQLPAVLPQAVAVLNPQRAGGDPDLSVLAGVGVAFCLAVGLRAFLRLQGFWQARSEPNLRRFCDLVALGTIADMVPLTGVNRLLTRLGLAEINHTPGPAIKALLEVSGCAGRSVEAEDVAFRLAPRINAAGRMDHAGAAVELLVARDPGRAAELARLLDQHNRVRQESEKTLLAALRAEIAAQPDLLGRYSLVLAGEEWHEGLLGIVAARLARRYARPAVLIATRNGLGRGSARSVAGFDLHHGLGRCAGLLEKFGGHAMAAGLQIASHRIAEFRTAFESQAAAALGARPPLPALTIDCPVAFGELSPHLMEELEGLKPYGSQNPEPLFLAESVVVTRSELVGRVHRRMHLQQADGRGERRLAAIQFNVDPQRPPPDHLKGVAFRLRRGFGRRRREPQLVIEDLFF